MPHGPYSAFVLCSQLIRPAVAEFFGLFDNARRTRRIDRRHLIRLAVHPDKRRKYPRPVFHGVAAVVLQVRNELVGPDAIFALVAMERRKRVKIFGRLLLPLLFSLC